jgi:hypothetical protein
MDLTCSTILRRSKRLNVINISHETASHFTSFMMVNRSGSKCATALKPAAADATQLRNCRCRIQPEVRRGLRVAPESALPLPGQEVAQIPEP